mmetsp:Transcript_22378/g.43545  ORF Transcript_22378/g.43545 Transcript_22378/m.43545 type:complete len:161 (+) Transcript_22378:252-734(+)
MLQWISASEAGKDIVYYDYGDAGARGLAEVTRKLLEAEKTVGWLWRELVRFYFLGGFEEITFSFAFVFMFRSWLSSRKERCNERGDQETRTKTQNNHLEERCCQSNACCSLHTATTSRWACVGISSRTLSKDWIRSSERKTSPRPVLKARAVVRTWSLRL